MDIFLKFHLVTIVPVLTLGPFILLRKQGDRVHVVTGRIWASLMVISCLLTFGIQDGGHYSWLHGLAIFTLSQIIRAIRAIKRKDIRGHQRGMVGSYLGALIAFLFAAAVPNRLLNIWIQNLFN